MTKMKNEDWLLIDRLSKNKADTAFNLSKDVQVRKFTNLYSEKISNNLQRNGAVFDYDSKTNTCPDYDNTPILDIICLKLTNIKNV